MRKDRKKGPGGGLMNEACQVVKLSFLLSFPLSISGVWPARVEGSGVLLEPK